jgi:hypothetical protein
VFIPTTRPFWEIRPNAYLTPGIYAPPDQLSVILDNLGWKELGHPARVQFCTRLPCQLQDLTDAQLLEQRL